MKRIMWREIFPRYRQGYPPRKERGRNSRRRPRPSGAKIRATRKRAPKSLVQSPDDFAHRPGFAKPTTAAGRDRAFTHSWSARLEEPSRRSQAPRSKQALTLVPDVVGKLHERSTNDRTVRDPRSGKGAAAVVIFPAHTADHGGLSSADIQGRTCKSVGRGNNETISRVLRIAPNGLVCFTQKSSCEYSDRSKANPSSDTLSQWTGGF